MQIVRGDYVKLLLKENEKADSKSCSKLKMTSYLFLPKKRENFRRSVIIAWTKQRDSNSMESGYFGMSYSFTNK